MVYKSLQTLYRLGYFKSHFDNGKCCQNLVSNTVHVLLLAIFKVLMYDLTSDGGYRCLFELDVGQLLQKYWNHKESSKATSNDGPSFISSQPSWQKQVVPDDEKESALEPGTTVLAVCFLRNRQLPCAEENTSVTLHKVHFGSQNASAIK